MAWRMDTELPQFSPPLMAAVQDYKAQTPLPSYYQLYPQLADLAGQFQRQTTRLMEHQTHIRGIWDQEYEAHQHQQ
ncbi:hypothetical protein A2U01_0091805 [Trifolium medium]|uniref:Uncharacterized protein n=1 Tax=Trifolium medium TaxID=97028 RepID=A0A392UAW4_9FABA|nr:hypothetical protein [Trifolium medium]